MIGGTGTRPSSHAAGVYAELVEVVVSGTNDNVLHCKQRMLGSLHNMVSNNPEMVELPR